MHSTLHPITCQSKSLCDAGKQQKQTSAQRRARKKEVAAVNAQAKFAWILMGAILTALLVVTAIMASRTKRDTANLIGGDR